MILNPADHLQPIVDIIACQNERLTGDGKYKLTAKQIPIGAKILAVAADYWRLTLGKTTGEEMTFSEVKTEMSKHIGTKYDPEILDISFSLENEISDTFIQAPLAVEELVPGMVLKQDIYTPSHMLLLPEGHVLTDKTIAKLSNYQTRTDADFTIVVAKEPSAPSA